MAEMLEIANAFMPLSKAHSTEHDLNIKGLAPGPNNSFLDIMGVDISYCLVIKSNNNLSLAMSGK